MKEEEKKKRWRPSLAAYRELEETIHQQCEELRGWSQQYHALMKRHSAVMADLEKKRVVARSDYDELQKRLELNEKKVSLIEEADIVSADLIKELREKNESLEQSKKQQLAEIKRLSNALDDKRNECEYLKSRGLWARIMNYLPVKE